MQINCSGGEWYSWSVVESVCGERLTNPDMFSEKKTAIEAHAIQLQCSAWCRRHQQLS
jgi:hypothetical protein